ncbi:embryonic polyadenylate-binding protein 2 isoform X1 [Ornithorhynchus anatinus]|uniref:embryonic polyadenylate-binding protein 2 isoform X1 n=1 Tax=Ornithorhynchus anatinus TaxID=9258 RepID=UPI000454316A|nr:embryonic polyadenylate-binding protein 2 isoform X1 [Ornithorhynchus anatinus]
MVVRVDVMPLAMWFSTSNSLFPAPSEAWLQRVPKQQEDLGWGGEGGEEQMPLSCLEKQDGDEDEENFPLSLLERDFLEDSPEAELPYPTFSMGGGLSGVRQREVTPTLCAGQELEAIKIKIWELEKAHERMKACEEAAVVTDSFFLSTDAGALFPGTPKEKMEADNRSVYVGNVDYGGTAEELESHFNSCGEINRVTILCDKFSGHPKGYAYIEFASESSVKAAVDLDESTFRGRIIKVLPKRTNMPGISSTDRGGLRGHCIGRGALSHRATFHGGSRSRPRGRIYRGRGRFSPWYSPY